MYKAIYINSVLTSKKVASIDDLFEPFTYIPIPTQSHSDYFLLLSQSSFLFFIHTKDKAHSVVVFITFKVPLLLVMDEKRKASKKDMSSFSSPGSLFSRSTSTSNSPLLRSLSQKSSSSSSKCNNNNLPRSFLERNPSIGSKCTKLAKEQKARFYIMRRCVAMLVCWHKHGDS